jgi:hypothetical protein
MSEETRGWIEISFNIGYLLVIWGIVVAMIIHQGQVLAQNRSLAIRLLWAFGLLALGDTGHVGFRVIAYARGGLAVNPALVGAGALSTAMTLTVFYMLILDVWRLRYQKRYGAFGWFLVGVGLVRLVIMLFPQNEWWQVTAPYNWSLLRNSFLIIQGLGVLALILDDAVRTNDRPFIWVGIMIALSYLFYAPVILWVLWIPILGMLMIPKTCAYLGIAFIVYRALFLNIQQDKDGQIMKSETVARTG